MKIRTSRSLRRSGQIAASVALETLEVRRLLANIVVNTVDDETVANATTSLREAVTTADGASGDDIITFDASVFSAGSLHTIELTQGDIAIHSSLGKVTIQGPGRDVLAVSGKDTSRIFTLDNSTNADFSGMTLTAGRATDRGGAISAFGTLALTDITFDANNTIGPNGADGNDTLPGGNGGFANGGAVYSSEALTVTNCTFSDNHAIAGNGGNALAGGGDGFGAEGGAIYAAGPTTITSSTFDGDTAVGGNAGQDTDGGSNASAGSAFGGAVIVFNVGASSISGSDFSNCVASGGKGADSLTTAGNGASAAGGAISSDCTGLSIEGCGFTNNQVNSGDGGDGGTAGGEGGFASGGALSLAADITVNNCSFDSNSVSGGASGNGPSASDAGDAAGGGVSSTVKLTMNDCTFSSNSVNGGSSTAADSGGGTAQGGGLYVAGTGTVKRTTFAANNATAGASGLSFAGQSEGGGVMVDGALTMEDSTVTVNSSNGAASGPDIQGQPAFGGGIMGLNGSLTIRSSTIDHNTVTGGDAGDGVTANGKSGGRGNGGGIYASSSLAMTNSTVAFNNATGGAGGNSSTFNGGSGALGAGGGLYLTTAVGNSILNCTIASNSATGGAGGTGVVNGTAGDSEGGNIVSEEQLNPKNTIISNGSSNHGPDLFGTFAPDHSLITSTNDATVLGSGNVIGSDPLLGPLVDNGGPTFTMVPDLGSPTHDAGDDSLATGILTNDQRGDGFGRFNGTIDIGSIEVGAALAEVSGNGIVIAKNDATPSSLDGTAFGTAKLGTPIDRTFTIKNIGQSPLNLGFVDLPFGFSVLTPFTSPVAPGDSTSLTIRFLPAFEGSFGGTVTISDNEGGSLNHIFFDISGTANGATTRVNFQPLAAEVPNGYLLDGGQSFAQRGNGYSYGWNQNAAVGARDREVDSDQRVDTLIHMQLYGTRTWEMSVPNGTYSVHVVMGDPSYTDSTYKLNVEGVLTVNGKPTAANHFVEGTKTVAVSDGKLSLTNASGAVNDKIDYIEITPVVAPPPTTKINFQTSGSPTPAGFIADSGAVFGSRGNGKSYGWNASASGFTRDRNAGNSPDQQHDTLVHTQLYGNRTWEYAVPNGSYQVHLVAGDPSFFDSVYKINVEGVLTVSGTPTSGNHWIEGTQTVLVSDGRLTVTNASGSVNNKLDYIEITPV